MNVIVIAAVQLAMRGHLPYQEVRRIATDGGTLTADRVVGTTHAPDWDRGLYFAMLEVQRSYCIAARLREEPPRGLSITATVNLRELDVLDSLNKWIGQLFAPENVDRTVKALVGSQTDSSRTKNSR